MAINPNILLTPTTPTLNIGQGLLRGIQGLSSLQQMQQEEQMAPIRQKMLEAQAAALPVQTQAQEVETALNRQRLADLEQQAEILRSATTANLALPAIERKDLAAFQQVLSKSNLSEDQRDYLSLLGEANRWDELKIIADKEIETAKLTGQFEKDLTGTSGYTSAGIQTVQYARELKRQLEAGVINKDQYDQYTAMLSRPYYGTTAEGVPFSLQTGTTQATPITLPPEAARMAEANAAMAALRAQQAEYAKNFPVIEKQAKSQIASFKNRSAQVDTLLAMKGKGLESAVGVERNIPGFLKLSGTDAQNYIAQYEKFTSGEFLTGVRELMGMGALSNAEGQKLQSLLSALSLDTDDETHLKTLQAIKDQTDVLVKTAETELETQRTQMRQIKETAAGGPPPSPPAPPLGGGNVDMNAPVEAAQTGSTYDREYDPKTGSYIPRGR